MKNEPPSPLSMRFMCHGRRAAAAFFAGGFLMVSAQLALAQEGEEQKPQQQGQEQKAPEQKGDQKGDQKSPEQAAAEQQVREIAEYKDAAAKLSRSAGSAECVWAGRRVASLLWRDDVDTAGRYMTLYERFGCSSEHLKLAFRCVVRQGPLDPKAQDRLAARVHGCWMEPEEPTTAATESATGSSKGGTIPN
jgi:hypothetical protein